MAFCQAKQKMLMEWFWLHEQPILSGDDMNIIQVGRAAVSCYHQTRKFFMEGQGVNHDVHDFPTAELGLKMGGFMLVHREGGRKRTSTWYDLP